MPRTATTVIIIKSDPKEITQFDLVDGLSTWFRDLGQASDWEEDSETGGYIELDWQIVQGS